MGERGPGGLAPDLVGSQCPPWAVGWGRCLHSEWWAQWAGQWCCGQAQGGGGASDAPLCPRSSAPVVAQTLLAPSPAPCSPEILWASCAATWSPRRWRCGSPWGRPGHDPGRAVARGAHQDGSLGGRAGGPGWGQLWSVDTAHPRTSHPSSEWPREPQVPPYVPKFQSGWEPPLDVLQEAPWEVEGLASAPGDEVRAPAAPPALHLRPLPSPPCPPGPAPASHQAPVSASPQPTPVSRTSFRNSTKHGLTSEPTPQGDVSSPHAHR